MGTDAGRVRLHAKDHQGSRQHRKLDRGLGRILEPSEGAWPCPRLGLEVLAGGEYHESRGGRGLTGVTPVGSALAREAPIKSAGSLGAALRPRGPTHGRPRGAGSQGGAWKGALAEAWGRPSRGPALSTHRHSVCSETPPPALGSPLPRPGLLRQSTALTARSTLSLLLRPPQLFLLVFLSGPRGLCWAWDAPGLWSGPARGSGQSMGQDQPCLRPAACASGPLCTAGVTTRLCGCGPPTLSRLSLRPATDRAGQRRVGAVRGAGEAARRGEGRARAGLRLRVSAGGSGGRRRPGISTLPLGYALKTQARSSPGLFYDLNDSPYVLGRRSSPLGTI